MSTLTTRRSIKFPRSVADNTAGAAQTAAIAARHAGVSGQHDLLGSWQHSLWPRPDGSVTRRRARAARFWDGHGVPACAVDGVEKHFWPGNVAGTSRSWKAFGRLALSPRDCSALRCCRPPRHNHPANGLLMELLQKCRIGIKS